jgi:hypothetical protein
MKHVWYKRLKNCLTAVAFSQGMRTKINPEKEAPQKAGLPGLSPFTKLSLAKLPAGIALLRLA